MLGVRSKALLRRQNRGLIHALPSLALVSRTQRIDQQIRDLETYTKAEAVCFPPSATPPDLSRLAKHALSCGKRVAQLAVSQESQCVAFHAVSGDANIGGHLSDAPFTVPLVQPGSIELIIVPVLAVDPSGRFIGDGSGCFDHALRLLPHAVSIAVAFDFQIIPESPETAGDTSVDWVVTDLRVFKVRACGTDVEPSRNARTAKEVRRVRLPLADPSRRVRVGGGDRMDPMG